MGPKPRGWRNVQMPKKRKLRPGKARERQANSLRDATNPCLNLEAPSGTYRIDRFFDELRASGIPRADGIPDDFKWLRKVIGAVGAHTIERARTEIIDLPCHFKTQKHQCELLLKLQGSIAEAQPAFAGPFGAAATSARDLHHRLTTKDRIKELASALEAAIIEGREEYVQLNEEYLRLVSAAPPCHPDELQERVAALEALSPEMQEPEALAALRLTSNLQKCLETADSVIKEWLQMNPPQQIASDNSPNKKPLSKWYMSFSAHAWQMMTGHPPTESEHEVFAKMLAAGWKDLGLDRYDAASGRRRTKEYRWFRDRLKNAGSLIRDRY
jgi:hypothetical protein